ncbi:MAG: FtsX-like permease family protein [Eubacterium sp.]|nr:FtsX-like permease family protein [Eubacterium sp.]
MTMRKVYDSLRKSSRGQYLLLGFCIFLSVLLMTSFALMYYGPTVQEFLPEGGDTRKMASLLLAVTAVGCFLFTVYASSLFFRYKSREYGVLMALGMQKKALRRLLFQELLLLTAAASLLGFACSVPVSFFIWKLFELFIISNEQMAYHFGWTGFLPGILFGTAMVCALGLAGKKFINRSNIMEILRTQQKSEMVKEIKSWTFPVGCILMVLGVLLGSGLSQFVANIWKINLPSVFYLVYLLSLYGIYLLLLSIVAQNRTRKNKKKYYANLVSISLMRFTAKATTRNMCVIVLLLFVCCFSVFYGTQYTMAPGLLYDGSGKAFAMHYPAKETQIETQIGSDEIEDTALRYQIQVTDFAEADAANLVISYHRRDFNEDGTRYLDLYSDREKAALFIPETAYQAATGKEVSVLAGHYKAVLTADFHEFFDFADGLKEAMNPDTGESFPLVFDGKLENNTLAQMSKPFLYVVNQADYEIMTQGLDTEYQEHLVFFNVTDLENSYDFAKDLLGQYVSACSARSDHIGNWDIWEQKLADSAGEQYGYEGGCNLSIENPLLLSDWKYAPQFQILTVQDRMQLISVYVMLSLYIFIISIAAVSVMCYVRSISVANDNQALFVSLSRLGAGRAYQRKVLKNQLARIFQYPAVIGCGLGYLFSFVMEYFNDGKLVKAEVTAMGLLAVIIAGVAAVLYVVYRYAAKKAEEIVGI